MLVSENVLEQALARLFDGKPAGASVSLAYIISAWAQVGLRKSDLRDAIREMVEARCLIPKNQLGYMAFELTPHGALRFDISRHHKGTLQKWLETKREVHDEESAFGASWDRRSLQY